LKTAAVSIVGSNLLNQVAEISKIAAFKKVNLNNIALRFKIADGKVTTEPFDIKLDQGKATVSGTTGLDQTIDYTMKMQVPRNVFGNVANDFVNSVTGKIAQAGVKVNPSEVLKFDIKIGGTFTKPIIKTGLRDAANSAVADVKGAIKDEINKKKEEVVATVKEEVNKALDDAQKKADALIAEAQKQANNIKAEAKKAGDKLIAEADAQGKKLIAEAKNPITKLAAEKTAKKLNQEAKDKAAKLNKEAEDKSNTLINKAKADGDKLIQDARAKAK
jgi:vacuolar-type H+-ATPase subunit H